MKLPNFEFKVADGEELTKQEQARQLRESFLKKVRTISSLREDIENPEISALTPDEFFVWVEQRKKELADEFPEAYEAFAQLEQMEEELRLLQSKSNEITEMEQELMDKAFQKYKEKNPESIEEKPDELEFGDLDECYSAEDKIKLRQLSKRDGELDNQMTSLGEKKNTIFHSSENPFLYSTFKFLDGIAVKRERTVKLQEAHKTGVTEFVGAIHEENLQSYLLAKGDGAQIEFTPFDVIIYITEAEKKDFFEGKEKNNGWHYSNTPISVVVKREPDGELYTKTHEMGHNRLECVKVAGVHQTIYADVSVDQLRERVDRLVYLKRIRTPDLIIESVEDTIRKQIRNQLFYLNGEISADVENIVQGRMSAFYFHFMNTASRLEGFTGQKTGREYVFGEEQSVDEYIRRFINEEIFALEEKVATHLKEILFYSHLARKYGKQGEFCSILVMNPDSPRLLQRFFSEELGDDFLFEEQMNKITPEAALPDVIYERIRNIPPVPVLMSNTSQPGRQALHNVTSKDEFLFSLFKNVKESKRGAIASCSNFEYVFKNKYSSTDLLGPQGLPGFLAVADKRSIHDVDQDAIEEIKCLLGDYVDDGGFSSIFDSFFSPGDDNSADSWIKTIDDVRGYEEQLLRLCEYVGDTAVGEMISEHIYDVTVYRALKTAVVSDDPTPLKQVFEGWKIGKDREAFFSADGTFLEQYDSASWFENEVLEKEYLIAPEKTKVYQYLLSVFD